MPRPNHNPRNFPEGSSNPHSGHWSNVVFGTYGYGSGGPEPWATILPDSGGLHSRLELPPQSGRHASASHFETTHTSFADSGNTDGSITQDARRENYHTHPTHPPSNLYEVLGGNPISPFQFNDPSDYAYQIQGTSAYLESGYAIKEASNYPDFHPNYPQSPVRQERQLASGFQSEAPHPNPDAGNVALFTLPHPRRPVCRGRKRAKPDGYSSHDPPVCHTCGTKFTRQSDLDRHRKTTRKHTMPGGPVCPEIGCKYKARFTRVDNFRAHYRG